MYYRKIVSRLRLGTAVALPVAIAALAFAGSANAASATPATVVFTPTTGPGLETAVTAADAEPAGTLSIIELGPILYSIPNPSGTAAMVLQGNIEITGQPTLQAFGGECACVGSPVNTEEPQVNGDSITTPADIFQVAAGAHVLMKAFDIEGGGQVSTSASAVEVQNGGTFEGDNMGFDGELGPALTTDSGGASTVSDSLIGDGSNGGPQMTNASATPTTLINDTIEGNSGVPMSVNGNASYLAINNLIVANQGPMCSTGMVAGSTNNLGDPNGFTNLCGSSLTTTTAAAINLQGSAFYGGPTISNAICNPQLATKAFACGSNSSAIGAGDPAFCPKVDQRFFPITSGTCDAGSYQSTSEVDLNNTAGVATTTPTCPTSVSINETANPATESVGVSDSGSGLGADAISYVANPVGADNGGATHFPTPSEPTPTDNGTVSYNTIGTTWFAATNPNAGIAAEGDFPSNSPFMVTATKPAGDTTVNDTHWSFDATNNLGITTYCH